MFIRIQARLDLDAAFDTATCDIITVMRCKLFRSQAEAAKVKVLFTSHIFLIEEEKLFSFADFCLHFGDFFRVILFAQYLGLGHLTRREHRKKCSPHSITANESLYHFLRCFVTIVNH